MNKRWVLFAIIMWATSVTGAELPSKLFYTSQTDFVEMSLSLKTSDAAQPRYISVDVKLSTEATARTAEVTALAMNKKLALYVNGRLMTTSMVHSVLDTGSLRFLIPREMLLDMMPSLMK